MSSNQDCASLIKIGAVGRRDPTAFRIEMRRGEAKPADVLEFVVEAGEFRNRRSKSRIRRRSRSSGRADSLTESFQVENFAAVNFDGVPMAFVARGQLARRLSRGNVITLCCARASCCSSRQSRQPDRVSDRERETGHVSTVGKVVRRRPRQPSVMRARRSNWRYIGRSHWLA